MATIHIGAHHKHIIVTPHQWTNLTLILGIKIEHFAQMQKKLILDCIFDKPCYTKGEPIKLIIMILILVAMCLVQFFLLRRALNMIANQSWEIKALQEYTRLKQEEDNDAGSAWESNSTTL